MKLIIVLFIISVTAEVKFYSDPGQYILYPDNYGKANTIEIEMWGSGGGGNSIQQSYSNHYYYGGGASGSYARFTIQPNNNNLIIVVGRGGDSGTDGAETSFKFSNDYVVINGSTAPTISTISTAGKITTSLPNSNMLKIIGQPGAPMTDYANADIYFGGSAPFGGNGGIYASGNMGVMNGLIPGGGGAAYGKGGDGMVIITYQSSDSTNSTDYSDTGDNLPFQYTDSYKQTWNQYGNANSRFFDSGTFGFAFYQSIGRDLCEQINTNSVYTRMINKYIECKGMHCIDRVFKCSKGNSLDCYNVEHIIDKGGPEFGKGNKCKNVAANLVMAWGKWNQQNGRMNGDYPSSINEKELIYGKDYMNIVRSNLRLCGCK